MLQIGNYNTLAIERITPSGALMASEEGNILLPGRLVPKNAARGDLLKVFIYVDSEERLTATTRKPRAVVGDFALLKVKDNVSVGTFLDWGLEKDLLLPFGEQNGQLRRGEDVLVYVYLHSSGRVAASARLDKFLRLADNSIMEGDEVDLLVYAFSDLGVKVVINNTYSGLLFRCELPVEPSCGEQLRGYIKRIREDGKIDVTLRKGGQEEAAIDRTVILDALKANNGFLPLNDKSSPEAIATTLRLSKKSFKKAVGGLYKDGLITLANDGIILKNS
jgi:predicted RNA-binding protein (virulence factor B family)